MDGQYRLQDPEMIRRIRESVQDSSRYNVGTYSFPETVRGGYLYIDKTKYVYGLTHFGSKYVFLSRPRRFGKSMLVSTLKSYFEGDRDLFQGLALYSLETEWEAYPVLHFNMSGGKTNDAEALGRFILNQIMTYERKFGTNPVHFDDISIRFQNLLQDIHEKTDKQIVVLVDEYDSPMLDVVHEEENLPAIRRVMQNFYSPLKACEQYLRFVFLTGITKFSQLSIFSSLNNITDISMEEGFAAVCGITEEELLSQMPEEVDKLAAKQGMTRQEALHEIKSMYDGYHFCWPSPDIYNPFSLMSALRGKNLNSYWFETGTPTYLINMMKKFGVDARDIEEVQPCGWEIFDAPTENLTNIVPLFYQSGYFTIKGYNDDEDTYNLSIPNREIRIGLYKSLLPNYITDYTSADRLIRRVSKALREDRIEDAMEGLKTFFSTIPYLSGSNTETQYQRDLCVIFSACGLCPRLEERTSAGRIDLVYDSKRTIHIIEIKLDGSPEEALQQINEKGYADKYALDGRPVVKTGVNFSSQTRNITGWIIEK